jgi:23S rRNA (guanosine2251-2'-O)-methyltransferase
MTIFGRNTLLQALHSEFTVYEVLLENNIRIDSKIEAILELCKQKKIPLRRLNNKKLDLIVGNKEHQGVAAKISFKTASLKDILQTESSKPSKSFIYISEATFEQNIGAIIRTAESAGLAGVIVPNDIKITGVSAKISTGAIFTIPIIQISIFQCIKELRDEGYKIIGIEKNGDVFYKSDISENSLFIIGGEDKSLSEPLRKQCDKIIEIPQFGKVNSLNMSVATAIILYKHIEQILAK